MKKLIVVILLCVGSLMTDAQPMARLLSGKGMSIPRTGLVREYLLNGDGTETVSGINGTLTGCTAIAGINGEINGAISFNGTSDFIQFTATSETASLGISVWLNLYNTTAAGYFLGYTSNGGMRYNGTDFLIKTPSGTTGTLAWTKVNGWVHLIVNRTGATTYDVYINTVKIGTLTNSTTDGLRFAYLGKQTLGYYYNGPMDNLRFYTRNLTSDEIVALYQEKL